MVKTGIVGIHWQYAQVWRRETLNHSPKPVYAIPNGMADAATRPKPCAGQLRVPAKIKAPTRRGQNMRNRHARLFAS